MRDYRNLLFRSFLAAVGLVIFSFGVYLTIQASIGLAPWDVLAMGISQKTSVRYGDVALITSVIILGIDILMKEPIGIGTILDALIVGKTTDLFRSLGLVPEQTTTAGGVILISIGLLIMASAQWIYMSAGLGCGPRDSFLVAIGKRMKHVPIGLVQNGILVIVLAAGFLFHGPIGIGTLISVFGIGAAMQFVFRVVKFEPRIIHHESLADCVKRAKTCRQ